MAVVSMTGLMLVAINTNYPAFGSCINSRLGQPGGLVKQRPTSF